MKSSLRSRQESRRVSNAVIIGAMLLSLCVLSIVKARYCATPFAGKAEDQLREQMNSSIRMETEEESPARTPRDRKWKTKPYATASVFGHLDVHRLFTATSNGGVAAVILPEKPSLGHCCDILLCFCGLNTAVPFCFVVLLYCCGCE